MEAVFTRELPSRYFLAQYIYLNETTYRMNELINGLIWTIIMKKKIKIKKTERRVNASAKTKLYIRLQRNYKSTAYISSFELSISSLKST